MNSLWRNNCIDLEKLGSPGNHDTTHFMKQYELEIAKISNFVKARLESARNAVLRLYDATSKPNSTTQQYEEYRAEAKEILDEVMLLDTFLNENLSLLKSLIASFQLTTDGKQLLESKLQEQDWDGFTRSIRCMLVKLSRVYALINKPLLEASLGEQTVSQSSFTRSTTKYFVDLRNLTAVKAFIIQHLPVLIFNDPEDKKKEAQSQPQSQQQQQQQITLDDHDKITSIYFDDEKFSCYHDRIRRLEGATLLRIRWYGNFNDAEVFVEKKTHHESWVSEPSTKERFPVKPKNINMYLSNDPTVVVPEVERKLSKMLQRDRINEKEFKTSVVLAHNVFVEIKERNLTPVVCTRYDRTAFQLKHNNDVRISIDTEMELIPIRDRQFPTPERLNSFESFHFPYAILEIKLRKGEPEWVSELKSKNWLIPMEKFSKFCEGTAYWYPERLSQYPYWMTEEELASYISREQQLRRAQMPNSPNLSQHSDTSISPLVALPGRIDKDLGSSLNEESSSDPVELVHDTTPHGTPPRTEGSNLSLPAAESPVSRSPGAKRRLTFEIFQENAVPRFADSTWIMRDPIPSTPNSEPSTPVVPNTPPRVMREAVQKSTLPNPSSSSSGKRGGGFFGSRIFGFRRRNGGGGGGGADQPDLAKISRKIRPANAVKIEPKTFFANERTFIQWMSAALTIFTLGVALFGFGANTDSRVTRILGSMLIPFAIILLVYGYLMFQVRSNRIKARRDGPYHDPYGPTILTLCLLFLIVATVTILWLDQTSSSSTSKVGPYGAGMNEVVSPSCLQVNFSTLSPFYELSTLAYNPISQTIFTCGLYEFSFAQISELDTPGAVPNFTTISVPDQDLESITIADPASNFVYLGSEGPQNAIFQFDLTTNSIARTAYLNDFVGTGPVLEGLEFVPDSSRANGGLWYVSTDSKVLGLDIDWSTKNAKVQAISGINIASREEIARNVSRISDLTHYNGRLYVLMDNLRAIRAYDLKLGGKVGEWILPGTSSQFEGLLILDNPDSLDPNDVYLYLAQDTPHDFWRFNFNTVTGFQPCTSSSNGLTKTAIIVIAVLVSAVVIVAVFIALYFYCRRRRVVLSDSTSKGDFSDIRLSPSPVPSSPPKALPSKRGSSTISLLSSNRKSDLHPIGEELYMQEIGSSHPNGDKSYSHV